MTTLLALFLVLMPAQDAKAEISRIIGLSGGEVSVFYRPASGPFSTNHPQRFDQPPIG